MDIPPLPPSLTPALPPLPGAHVPQVVHSLRCSFLIDKHILPVHHRKGIKNGAQGLDGCGNNRGSGHPFSRSPPPACPLIPITHPERPPCWAPFSGANGLESRFPIQRHRRNGQGQTALWRLDTLGVHSSHQQRNLGRRETVIRSGTRPSALLLLTYELATCSHSPGLLGPIYYPARERVISDNKAGPCSQEARSQHKGSQGHVEKELRRGVR